MRNQSTFSHLFVVAMHTLKTSEAGRSFADLFIPPWLSWVTPSQCLSNPLGFDQDTPLIVLSKENSGRLDVYIQLDTSQKKV